MYTFVQQIEHSIEHLSSTCGQAIVSAVNYFTMAPWIGLLAGIIGFIATIRVMCR